MLKGDFKSTIQVGYESKTTHQRNEGEEWVDVNNFWLPAEDLIFE